MVYRWPNGGNWTNGCLFYRKKMLDGRGLVQRIAVWDMFKFQGCYRSGDNNG